ncbi:hypothetical protein BC828DRAFT_373111 [Blastocladiella britannica]|nr:hypothetical protein BC828DRAFT_373111 [Blastocladiella britannica]
MRSAVVGLTTSVAAAAGVSNLGTRKTLATGTTASWRQVPSDATAGITQSPTAKYGDASLGDASTPWVVVAASEPRAITSARPSNPGTPRTGLPSIVVPAGTGPRGVGYTPRMAAVSDGLTLAAMKRTSTSVGPRGGRGTCPILGIWL